MPAVLDSPVRVDIALRVAEAVQPGALVVHALRVQQIDAINLMRAEMEREFKLLGQVATAAAAAQGGLIMESKQERERVAAIVAAMSIPLWTKTRLVPAFQDSYKRIASLTMKTLNRFDLEVSLRDKLEARLLSEGGKQAGLIDIAGEAKQSIFDAIEDGRTAGLNPRDTAKLLEDYVPAGRFRHAGVRYRSQLIARTEALNAQRVSSIDMYRSSPVVKETVAFDGDEDEECSARNGETFTFDDAEVEAEGTHPNCVLAFGPVT